MGILVYSLLWVMQGSYHQQYDHHHNHYHYDHDEDYYTPCHLLQLSELRRKVTLLPGAISQYNIPVPLLLPTKSLLRV